MVRKRASLWLCIWTLALGLFSAPAGLAMPLEGSHPSEGAPTSPGIYHLTLDTQVIGAGETRSYETVAPELAGNPFAADYYPGELTLELAGQTVIEDGGRLVIGTLSSGNEKEASPVLRGTLAPDGLIVVRPGGSLILKNVSLDLEGEGLLIVQEPGGAVELSDTATADGLVAWAAPMVDNTYQQPRDLWLEEGIALDETMLPDTLDTYLQHQGNQEWKSIALQWEMDGCDGQTEGEHTLTGTFLDESGAALASVRPLTLTVHWVESGRLVITDTVWMGDDAASAKLELKELPGEADEVWGEVSADGGESWQRWDGFELRQSEAVTAGVFALPDATPRRFRVRAANARQHLYWVSEAVLLPKEETKPSDQGGNRGGSTAVIQPHRTPKPASSQTPTQTPTPMPTPVPTPTVTPTPIPTPPPTPTPTVEPTPVPTAEPTAEPIPTSASASSMEPAPAPEATPSAAAIAPVAPVTLPPKPVATARPTPAPSASETRPTPTPSPTPTPTPAAEIASAPAPEVTPSPSPAAARAEGPAPALQALLVTAGVALCALVGVFVARKKRK